ncbi:copper chaperone PCu(A)C [Altererythrobacter sp. CC-YST694]|uniref:copper chaperone PCu(A)C n=1 Tax=Altererythrobacter sp. CC-YST694 TaxID=2755038 RepID=UPI001D034AF7|nr:copper chaperone PCu(A)C [Altererythrobacter sp. CC-YST694]MCB5426444.1 copper chaperone PCu(A)C [Altererythrobacter sp. CC-YST694]
MIIANPKTLLGGMAIGLIASAALAHGYKAGDLSIQHPWSRQTAPGQTSGGGFMTVLNNSPQPDRLLSATSPAAAEVQLHSSSVEGGVMRMRRMEGGIAIPAKGRLELKPGSYHIMFIGLKQPLRKGERVPVTLKFQRAGKIDVQFAVQPIGSTGPMEGEHAGH